MPYDRNSTQNKPLLPRVANNPKSPLTPRLAAQHLRATQSPSNLSVASSRTDLPRTAIISPKLKEDLNTPVKSLIDSNITPRSSNRKSRIEANSVTSTPTQTPVQTPIQNGSTRSKATTATQQGPVKSRPKSVVLDSSSTVGNGLRANGGSPVSSPGNVSTREMNGSFFHATDAKRIEPGFQPKKAATFFYANGQKEEAAAPLNRAPSPPLSTVSARSHKSHFYRADGTLDDEDEGSSPPNSPTMQRSPELPNSRPVSQVNAFPFRPPSPQKMNLHLTYRKGASQIMSLQSRSQALPNLIPNTAPRSPSPTSEAKLPNDSQMQNPKTHLRTGSLSSIDSSPASQKTSLNALEILTRPGLYARGETTSSAPTTARIPPTSHPFSPPPAQEPLPSSISAVQSRPTSAIISNPASPTQPVANTFAEAAANARRERKVLDLEISNSSLLAINRQLEREVRRQKTELRRFRRLSRAGRLTSLGSTMIRDEEDTDGEDMVRIVEELDYELSDSENDEDPDSSMSDESLASSCISNSVISKRGTARLEKDEKRLQLDLSRHRQLLVDSQKMNQSLKRCMTLSEEMIEEAKRALEYKVHVSDIKLGGRVLQIDEVHETSIGENGVEEANDGEVGHRRALLGAWSPPDGTTPLATIPAGQQNEGLFGLALSLDLEQLDEMAANATSGLRDSEVHVNESSDSPFSLKA